MVTTIDGRMRIPEHPPQILGIGHKARVGKDTLANWLAENCGYEIIHWSDELYRECRECEIFFRGDWEHGTFDILLGKSQFMYNSWECPRLYTRVYNWLVDRQGSYPGGRIECSFYGMTEKDASLLQWWGTDFRRCLFGEDYWISKVHDKIFSSHDEALNPKIHGASRFVVPDTRFRNEARAIKEWGGLYCDVRRSEPAEPTGRDPNHPSEVDLDGWEPDFTVDSNGSLEEYLNRIQYNFNHWRE